MLLVFDFEIVHSILTSPLDFLSARRFSRRRTDDGKQKELKMQKTVVDVGGHFFSLLPLSIGWRCLVVFCILKKAEAI
jgi:hypothetical protein